MNSAFLHKLFGTTPGEGVQPKEAIAYSIAGFGQNFICIIGSYLTIFLTDALLFGAEGVTVGTITGSMAVAYLMLGTRIFDAFNDPIMGSIVDKTRTRFGKFRPWLFICSGPGYLLSLIYWLLPIIFAATDPYHAGKLAFYMILMINIYLVVVLFNSLQNSS